MIAVFALVGWFAIGVGAALVDCIVNHINEEPMSSAEWVGVFLAVVLFWPLAVPNLVKDVKRATAALEGHDDGR